jgi:hypothetical protein
MLTFIYLNTGVFLMNLLTFLNYFQIIKQTKNMRLRIFNEIIYDFWFFGKFISLHKTLSLVYLII